MSTFDFSELRKLKEQLERVNEQDIQLFMEECTRELAARLLAKAVKRTPVGKGTFQVSRDADHNIIRYKRGKKVKKAKLKQIRQGGNLRHGWTISPGISRHGNDYILEVINAVPYASYVEYGHRQTPGRYIAVLGKCLKKGWVQGKFMLTISEQELRALAPNLLKSKIEHFMQEVLRGE